MKLKFNIYKRNHRENVFDEKSEIFCKDENFKAA